MINNQYIGIGYKPLRHSEIIELIIVSENQIIQEIEEIGRKGSGYTTCVSEMITTTDQFKTIPLNQDTLDLDIMFRWSVIPN